MISLVIFYFSAGIVCLMAIFTSTQLGYKFSYLCFSVLSLFTSRLINNFIIDEEVDETDEYDETF